MQRVKSFEATGVAPNGKVYAGDLNAIQDAVAALTDYAQLLGLGTLRIGEAGLTLSRIGTLEAQLAGHLRVTKILRALEGIIPGAFTTAERDAIAAGGAPYGIAILNSQTNRWEWNAGTDGARVWKPLGGSIVRVNSGGSDFQRPRINLIPGSGILIAAADDAGGDEIDVTFQSPGSILDTFANRPAAASVPLGTIFIALDQGFTHYVRDADPSWEFVSQRVVSAFSASRGNGQTYSLNAPSAGDYLLEYGAGDFFESGQGASMTLTDNVSPAGTRVRYGTVAGGGGSVCVTVTLTAGQTVTITASGNNSLDDCWAKLTRIA